MKIQLTLFVLFIGISTGNAQQQQILQLQMKDWNIGPVEITRYTNDGKTLVDTIEIKNVSQEFKYIGSNGLLIRIAPIKTQEVNARYFNPLAAVTEIVYNAGNKSFQLSGAVYDRYSNKFFNLLDSLTRKLQSLYGSFYQAQASQDQKKVDSISSIFIDAKRVRFNAVIQQLKESPNSSLSAYLLYENFALGISEDSLVYTYNRLGNDAKNSYFGKKIKDFIDTYTSIKEGAIAPDFVLKDEAGKTVTLKDFNGKWVLVDFWASWCVPCRKKHPEMKATFAQLAGKSIAFVGISLDTDRASWLDAIKTDGLPWKQLIAIQGFDSPVAERYGIKSIPLTILIGPDGKIIKKNPSMTELKTLL